MSVQFTNSSYTITVFQLSIFSDILLLSGGLASIGSTFILFNTNDKKRLEIARYISFGGFFTQLFGLTLMLFAYNDIISEINAITTTFGSTYVIQISSLNGLLTLSGQLIVVL